MTLHTDGEQGFATTDNREQTTGAALRSLPKQMLGVLTHPSATTFEREQRTAGWGIVWILLIGWTLVDMALQWLNTLINPLKSLGGGVRPSPLLNALYSPLSQLVTPLVFFVAVSVLFLLARAFGGRGRYVTLAHAILLFGVPLSIVSSLLALIPVVGSWLFLLPHLYNLLLTVLALMGVQRLSVGRAIGVVLIPLGLLLLLSCGLLVAVVLIAAQQIH